MYIVIVILIIIFSCKIVKKETNIYYNHLLKNKLTKKSIVNMKFVMYHGGIFYMRDKSFGKSFSLLSSMINEYCGLNLHPYLPHNDEVCLGKFPGNYCFLTHLILW